MIFGIQDTFDYEQQVWHLGVKLNILFNYSAKCDKKKQAA